MSGEPASALVVLPVLNEAEYVESVLSQLAQRLPEHLAVRFVVVDGGSTDDTVEIATRLAHTDSRILVLHNPKRLQSSSVNMAVRMLGAEFEVLIRCDAHSIYPPGYVWDLIQTLNSTGADAVVVPMDSRGEGCLRKAIAWVSDTMVGSGGAAHRGGARSGYVDHGHHAAFRMAMFAATGGYDESFSHNEDAELDSRQGALGARIYLDASIRIGYVPRSTLRGLWRQYFSYGNGRSRTVRKHPQSLRLRQFIVPAHVILSLLCLAGAAWRPLLLLWPGMYAGILCLTACLLSMTHRSFCGLLAAPAALSMHIAWALGFLSGLVTKRQRRWSSNRVVPLEMTPR
jgi:succinoglycan biosynthesis protein ExoA